VSTTNPLRTWWPGWRWASVFIVSSVMFAASLALVAFALDDSRREAIERQYNYCRLIGQPWERVGDNQWHCNTDGYFKPWPESGWNREAK